MMVTLHTPLLLLLFFFSTSLSLPSSPPPFILSSHTLHSVCSTDFLPPVSLPPFYPPHLASLPDAAALRRPKFPFHLSSPSIHLCIWPRSTSPAAQSITYRLHYPAPFLLLLFAFFRPAFLPIPPLVSPLSIPLRLACLFCFGFFAFSDLASASCPPRLVCLLSPFCFFFLLFVSFWPVN